MKKYVNGKIVEMTEADIAKRESRISHRSNSRKSASDYETRVKELENTVAELLSQIKEEEAPKFAAEETVAPEET